jgi:hypothetical protein
MPLFLSRLYENSSRYIFAWQTCTTIKEYARVLSKTIFACKTLSDLPRWRTLLAGKRPIVLAHRLQFDKHYSYPITPDQSDVDSDLPGIAHLHPNGQSDPDTLLFVSQMDKTSAIEADSHPHIKISIYFALKKIGILNDGRSQWAYSILTM